MSRILAFFVAVTALSFLFTFAHARVPLDLRGNDVTSIDDRLADLPESDPKDTATLPVNDVTSSDNRLAYLPESDTKETATIVLPSEKHDSEPATLGEVESEEVESTESKLPGKEISTSKSIQEESETKKVETVPLTVITFRPINRHFLQRPLFPFRPGHRCHGRHQHQNQFKPWGGLRFKSHRDLSFANDITLSGGEDLGFDPVTRGRPHQIPARWTRFNHGGSRFSIIKDESREEMIKWPHHRRHHHHHHHDEEREEHEHEHEHEHGFMKKIRKFLNHF